MAADTKVLFLRHDKFDKCEFLGVNDYFENGINKKCSFFVNTIIVIFIFLI
jgi:hypothetical protein